MDFNWEDDFIENEVMAYNSEENNLLKELYAKSYCEYILYCYQISSHSILSPKKKAILFELKKKPEISYCKIILNLCLKESVDLSTCDFINSIEYSYIRDLVNREISIPFWNQKFSIFLKTISSEGISIEETYNLTHYIFYSTNFGKNKKIIEQNNNLKKILNLLINTCISKYEKAKNWDLCCELYICLLILDNQKHLQIREKVQRLTPKIKSKSGWFLSNGQQKVFFENHYKCLNFKQKYSLFHTTILFNLLDVLIKNYAQQAVWQNGGFHG